MLFRSVAAKLRTALSSAAFRERVGQGGREFVRAHLDWGKVASEMEALFARLTGARRAGTLA